MTAPRVYVYRPALDFGGWKWSCTGCIEHGRGYATPANAGDAGRHHLAFSHLTRGLLR